MNINWRIVFLLVLASVAANCVKPSSKFEEGLLKVLEKCKSGDVASLPIPAPSLKSFKLEPMQIKYDGFTTELSGIIVKGLERLTLEKFSASDSDLTVSMVFSVPALEVLADRYHLQGKVLIVNINDRGTFKADIRNLRATAVVKFAADGSNTMIKKIDIEYSLGKVKAHLGGSNGIVNSGFNKKLTKMLSTDKHTVITKAKHEIGKVVNKMLRGFTPAKLIEVISKI